MPQNVYHCKTNAVGRKKSKYPGVVWYDYGKRWRAQLTISHKAGYAGKTYSLGFFDTQEEAFEHYCLAFEYVNGFPYHMHKRTPKQRYNLLKKWVIDNGLRKPITHKTKRNDH